MKAPGSWRFRAVVVLLVGAALATLVVGGVQLAALVWVRHALARLPGYASTYEITGVGAFPPSLELTQLRLVPESPSSPILTAERLRAEFSYGDLLRLLARPRITLDRAKLVVFVRSTVARPPPLRGESFSFDEVKVRGGELLLVLDDHRADDVTQPAGNAPVLWLHDLEGTLDTSIPSEATLRIEGKVAATGTLALQVNADVTTTDGPHFSGQALLTDLALGDLYAILQHAGTRSDRTLDLSVRAEVNANAISGFIQPTLRDGTTKALSSESAERLLAALSDGAAPLTTVRGKARRVAGAEVPFTGKLADPAAETWATTLAVFQNTFALGLAEAPGEGGR